MDTKYLNGSLLKKPTAFIPILMSAGALTLVLIHWAIFGIVRETDEGTLAHIFQILMVLQIPIAAYFLFSWVNKKPKQTIQVIVLQLVAWVSAIVAVLLFT